MPETKIDSAVASDLTNVKEDYSVPSESTDGPIGSTKTIWTIEDWDENLGFYKIPELRAVIDAKGTWTVGKGFKADEVTTMLLDAIKGWGNDTINTILENMIRTYHIAGDSFAEIMRDEDDVLINIKPLDPSTIRIIVDESGLVLRYEQFEKGKPKDEGREIKKEDMFHLSKNRVADEIHGNSIIPPLKDIILMRNEAMSDWKKVLHWNVEPRWIFHLDTDDTTEIAAFKAKEDAANSKGENLYIPKGVVVPEMIAVAQNSTLNPLTWIQNLTNYFYQAAGVPKIIVGGADEFTEASAKIAYLIFQQNIEEEQLYMEEQVLAQLGLEIELEFPASLENELLSDKEKDGDESEGAPDAAQPSDTTAGEGQ